MTRAFRTANSKRNRSTRKKAARTQHADLLTFMKNAQQVSDESLPTKLRFNRGASAAQLRQAEQTLRMKLPEPLRTLLSQSNGVTQLLRINGRWHSANHVVWKLQEIVKQQAMPHRDEIGPPGSWLVFAHAGSDGILFGYDLDDSTDRIWAWHPIEARRQLIASSFASFLRRWLGDRVRL